MMKQCNGFNNCVSIFSNIRFEDMTREIIQVGAKIMKNYFSCLEYLYFVKEKKELKYKSYVNFHGIFFFLKVEFRI